MNQLDMLQEAYRKDIEVHGVKRTLAFVWAAVIQANIDDKDEDKRELYGQYARKIDEFIKGLEEGDKDNVS